MHVFCVARRTGGGIEMKTAILMLAVLSLLAVSVSAGSISGLDHSDCTENGFLWWHDDCWDSVPAEINDNDVDIDADTVGGSSIGDIHQAIADKEDKVGGGMGSDGLSYWFIGSRHLFDTYDRIIDFLHDVFASDVELEAQAERIDLLEARLENPGASEDILALKAGLKKAERLQEDVIIDGFVCRPGYEHCFRRTY